MKKDNFFNFTKQAIEKITGPKFTRNKKGKIIRPEIVQHIYRDSIVKGLALHVSYKGTKSFFLHKTTKGVRYDTMLGIFPSMSVEQARFKAEKLKKQIVTTDNISHATSLTVIPIKTAANNDSEMTFKQLLDKARNHARIKEYRSWEKEYPLLEKRTEQIHDKKLSTITANDIEEICNNCLILEHPNPRFTGKVAANRCLSNLDIA